MAARSLYCMLSLIIIAAFFATPHVASSNDKGKSRRRAATGIEGKVMLIRLDHDGLSQANRQVVLTDARLETIGDVQFVTGKVTEPFVQLPEGGFKLEVHQRGRAAVKWNAVEYFAAFDSLADCQQTLPYVFE